MFHVDLPIARMPLFHGRPKLKVSKLPPNMGCPRRSDRLAAMSREANPASRVWNILKPFLEPEAS